MSPAPSAFPPIAPNIAERSRRTSIKKGEVSIETVEHCLAAIHALEIDNIIDRSRGARAAGARLQQRRVRRRSSSRPGSSSRRTPARNSSSANPSASLPATRRSTPCPTSESDLNITYDLDYSSSSGDRPADLQLSARRRTASRRAWPPARSFLLEVEAKQFQARGIGTHIGPNDILVIDSDGPIKNAYRLPNECVRHKIVDLIGDLTLVGRPVIGRIVAYKSGHALNQQLVRKLYDAAQQQDRIERFGTDAVLDIRRIQKILPHRYPFLLVDKIIEVEGDTRIKGIKNVTFNEQFFQGHFPSTPIMPGVLIVEAMAQVSGLLFAQRLEHTGKLAMLLSMDNVKLRKAVVPGDQLILIAETVRLRRTDRPLPVPGDGRRHRRGGGGNQVHAGR